MVTKSKIAALVAVAAVSVASPVFARSPHPHRWNSSQANPHSGLHAFATVTGAAPSLDPGGRSPSNPVDNPATAGGGSMGYNHYMGHAH
jgi:hypothetical protein